MISFHGGEATASELEGYRELGLEHVLVHLETAPIGQTLERLDGLEAEFAKLA